MYNVKNWLYADICYMGTLSFLHYCAMNIGSTHVLMRSRGSCLNTRPLDRVFKHRPRDPASVNAKKTNVCDRYSSIFT